ncbi:zinc-ribbon domain-containing protein [Dysosmobacter sp.]|uniref:zinc-ribbon domain-containing protein n=1 Tax=Dysosmobacter sp. TaxID=2591382 RepID=UPI002A8E1F96|nr:zinc ribbon domain-containing protein [Dysosmobacter sp.]MDY3281246.1 zinc-ribbon domain-containing protein [Dysosmobacter sp.]
MTAAEKARYDTLEAFGFGPNVMRKTAVCGTCGRMADAGAAACPACGGKLPEETLYDCYKRQHACCPACGTVLSPGSRYCPSCGKRVFCFMAGRRRRAGRT